jgi:DNA-binding HxlR family transcriptional regulator
MAARRHYFDGCAAAHALDLVGERWALLVARELILGPKRFTDLRAGITHASPNVLAQRLRELEEAGIVRRRKLPPPASTQVYELTEWGLELEPVLQALGRFGSRSPSMPREGDTGTDTLILAMRTMFDAELAADVEASFQLDLGGEPFRVRVAGGELHAERGTAEDPDATIAVAKASDLGAVIFGGRPLADALDSGDVRIEGDRKAVERLIGVFPLPEPVAA